MPLSLALCLLGLVFTVLLVRDRKPSLGLPVAYCYLLLLNHVPGAISHMQGMGKLAYAQFTEWGFRLTAIGVVAFVAGLWLARRTRPPQPRMATIDPGRSFLIFCLAWGWITTFALLPILSRIPSIGAAADSGSKIWLVAILIALPLAVERRRIKGVLLWLAATLVYPVTGLLGSGFLSYGSTTTVQAFSLFPVRMRSLLRFFLIVPLVTFFGIGVFVTYFSVREDIRKAVWDGASLGERAEESAKILEEFNLLDPKNEEHLDALNQRLNQNVFVGMAAHKIASGQRPFYEGRSIAEGLMSLVPRIIWPDKPVFGGSPRIVNEMTYFKVNEKTTSYGVGNVMEFYINWGTPSLVIGFVLYGWFLGWLDHGGAKALVQGRLSDSLRWILPAFAVIRPGESIVEMAGGAAAAWVAAVGWGVIWEHTKGGKVRVLRGARAVGGQASSVESGGRKDVDGGPLAVEPGMFEGLASRATKPSSEVAGGAIDDDLSSVFEGLGPRSKPIEKPAPAGTGFVNP